MTYGPWVFGSILVGALFAAADAAVTALPESRLRAMVETERDPRPSLLRVLEDPLPVLSRLLVGRVVCIVGASVLAAIALHGVYPRYGALVALAGVALAYTMLAEVVTSVVRARAVALAPMLLTLVRPLELAVMPLAVPVAWLGGVVTRLFPAPSDADAQQTARIAEAEVEYLIEQGQKTGAIPDGHAELLQAAFDFKGKIASDVLVPRTHMISLTLGTPLARVLELIASEGHSRYPVHDQGVDDIIGLLHVKDLFLVVREGRLESTSLADLIRKPVLVVQENQSVAEILHEMRHKRQHLGVVVDEHGGTAGLITLEDILELLVGDIRDELDDDEPIQPLGDGRLLVDAALSVDEVSQRLGVSLPEGPRFVSIGGMLAEHLGKVPEVGQTIRIGSIEIVVREGDARRVRRVEIVRMVEAP